MTARPRRASPVGRSEEARSRPARLASRPAKPSSNAGGLRHPWLRPPRTGLSRPTLFRSPDFACAIFVFLIAALVYLPTLRAGFVWDDHFIVEANRQIRSLTNLPALLGSHAFSG